MHRSFNRLLQLTYGAAGTTAVLAGLLGFGCNPEATAQAAPTATKGLNVSIFGGLTGNYTGVAGGRNLDLTAGADIGFRPFFSFYPALEGRGEYTVDGGAVDQEKNILGGLQLARHYGRFHPYGDVLFGRGAISYQKFRFPAANPAFYYVRSVSDVLSIGGGIDVALTSGLLLKLDAQLQRYSSPVTTSGTVYSKPITVGVVYRFRFRH